MALSKSYLSVNGELYAEWTEEAKTEVGYIRDALGNVMETVNADGTTLNTYNYKPFGDVLSKTGVEPDPKYLWCGTWGYRASGNKWVSHYVRARHYSFADAAWTSVDPLWPSEMPYGYVENRVMTAVDPSGMKCQRSNPKGACAPNEHPDAGCGCWLATKWTCLKADATFQMKLAKSSKLIMGSFSLSVVYYRFDCWGNRRYITKSVSGVLASSGLPNHQYEKSWCIKNKGPIPPSSQTAWFARYKISTSCESTWGFRFKISPASIVLNSCKPSVNRDGFFLHLDLGNPGTAGCIGLKNYTAANSVKDCLLDAADLGCSSANLTVEYK